MSESDHIESLIHKTKHRSNSFHVHEMQATSSSPSRPSPDRLRPYSAMQLQYIIIQTSTPKLCLLATSVTGCSLYGACRGAGSSWSVRWTHGGARPTRLSCQCFQVVICTVNDDWWLLMGLNAWSRQGLWIEVAAAL